MANPANTNALILKENAPSIPEGECIYKIRRVPMQTCMCVCMYRKQTHNSFSVGWSTGGARRRVGRGGLLTLLSDLSSQFQVLHPS